MAQPSRTIPLYHFWYSWALAGATTIATDSRTMTDLHLAVTRLSTIIGMLDAGIRPASQPTSTSKE